MEDNQQDDENDQEYDESEEAPEESRQPANSIAEAYRLLTPSVKVSFQLQIESIEQKKWVIDIACIPA